MRRAPLPLLILTLAALTGCTSTPTTLYGQEVIVVLEVAPERVPCQGEMEDLCLQVREPGEEEWRKFYDPIDGFEHEPGFLYTLRVSRREVLNPPADGSAFDYTLIEILEKEAAGG